MKGISILCIYLLCSGIGFDKRYVLYVYIKNSNKEVVGYSRFASLFSKKTTLAANLAKVKLPCGRSYRMPPANEMTVELNGQATWEYEDYLFSQVVTNVGVQDYAKLEMLLSASITAPFAGVNISVRVLSHEENVDLNTGFVN